MSELTGHLPLRRRVLRVFAGVCALVAVFASYGPVLAADVRSTYQYESTVSTDGGGALDLVAELNYDSTQLGAPIAVVMHPYSCTSCLGSVRTPAARLRDKGFFAISVAMRGRDGSDGVRDSGGVEIYDIYDAVEAVKADPAYADLIDPTNVHITGYSGGGGNTMSALTKFPDYFRAGAAFFGMSDYGFDPVDGWYNFGAGGRTSTLNNDIGNPNTGGPAIVDRYHARASNLASQNNPYSQIHLFVDDDETICPKINSTSFRDNAVAAETFSGEFDNITAHIGVPGTYEDFDNSGTNDPDEEQAWPHQIPTVNQQNAAEQWYVPGLLDGSILEPVLNSSDELLVAGFVKTKPFGLWLGDGQDSAGLLSYSLSADAMSFSLEVVSNDKSKTGKLTVDASETFGAFVEMTLDGQAIGNALTSEGVFEYDALGHEQTLELQLFAMGDLNRDGAIDGTDHGLFAAGLHADISSLSLADAYAMGDVTGDGLSNVEDFLLFRAAFDAANGQGSFAALQAAMVPEPTALAVWLVSSLCLLGLRTRSKGALVSRQRSLTEHDGFESLLKI